MANNKTIKSLVIEMQSTLNSVASDLVEVKTKIEVGEWESRIRLLEHDSIDKEEHNKVKESLEKKIDSLQKNTQEVKLLAVVTENKIVFSIAFISFVIMLLGGIPNLFKLFSG